MNKKSFLLGVLTGIILTFVGIFVIGIVKQGSSVTDPIHYLDQPVSYENKTKTSFKVFQVLGDYALANEVSNEKYDTYFGNTVLILGDNFYSDQIVTIKNPLRIGTYNYTNNSGIPMTVPVLNGEL